MPCVVSPGQERQMQVAMAIEECPGQILAGTTTLAIVPILPGSTGQPIKNFQRSDIIRPDRQGGKQVGGTRSASGSLAVPVANELSIYGILAAAMGGSFTNVPGGPFSFHAGPNVKTLHLQYRYTLGDGSFLYDEFLGVVINTARIDIPTEGGARITFDWLGIDDSATPGLTAYTQPANANPMAGSVAGTQITWGGAALTGAETATITINNNAALKNALGQATADHIGYGDFDADAAFSVYLRANTLRADFDAEARKALAIKLVESGVPAHTVEFVLTNAVLTGIPKGTSGPTVTQQCTAFAEVDTSATPTKMMVNVATGPTLLAGEEDFISEGLNYVHEYTTEEGAVEPPPLEEAA